MLDRVFQSTRPRGRTRRAERAGRFSETGFNPRVLAGGRDPPNSYTGATVTVSIHASSREDATCGRQIRHRAERFNPRVLAGGRDVLRFMMVLFRCSFNPRGLAGGRDTHALTCRM